MPCKHGLGASSSSCFPRRDSSRAPSPRVRSRKGRTRESGNSGLGTISLTNASSFVISIFGIIVLSVLGLAFKNNHEEFVGGIEDPADGPAVAGTLFTAVLIYVVGFLLEACSLSLSPPPLCSLPCVIN